MKFFKFGLREIGRFGEAGCEKHHDAEQGRAEQGRGVDEVFHVRGGPV